MHTTAVWWQVEAAALEEAFATRYEALDGFLSAAFAMHFVAGMLTMSAPQDLGRAVGNSDAGVPWLWRAAVGSVIGGLSVGRGVFEC